MLIEVATALIEKKDIKKLEEYTANTQWLLENMPKLRQEYPDRFVAVTDAGKQVFYANTLDELLKQLSKLGKDTPVCATHYISREEYALIV